MGDAIPPAAIRLARRHGGHARRDTLLEAGMTPSAITRRVRNGTFIAEFAGVYAIGRRATRPQDRAWAALLACGDGSALYGQSALAAYRLERSWRIPFSVISPHDCKRDGVHTLRARWLTPDDIRWVEGLPVTTPALTLLHNAPARPEKRLRRDLNQLRLEHGLTLAHVDGVVKRFPRHPGAKPLAHLLRTSETNPTRSAKEDLWRPYATTHNLPPYEMNVPFTAAGHTYIVDVYLPDPGLIIELDGGLHDLQTRQDHARDIAILTAHNLPTIRIDPDELLKHPEQQAQTLHAAIDAIRRQRHGAA